MTLLACNEYPALSRAEGESCERSLDCEGALVCSSGVCRTGGYDSASSSGSSSGGHAYWCRNDGMGTAQLQLSGSVARACTASFGETIGTFDGDSMTFVISGQANTFPLEFRGSTLIVGAPNPDTHNATEYQRCSTYDCSGGGGDRNPDEGGGEPGGGGDNELPANRCTYSPECSDAYPYSCDTADSCYATLEACAYSGGCAR